MSTDPRKSLTGRQAAVLDAVEDYARQKGYPPTLREIGRAVGLDNVSAVRGHLEALEKKGYIAREADKARSIRVLHAAPGSAFSRFKRRLHQIARTDEGVVQDVVYGIVLATDQARRHFVDRKRRWIEQAIARQAAEHGWTLLLQQIEPDHVVLILKVWPTHSAHTVAHRIRHACNAVRRRHLGHFPGRRLWSPGFGATTDLRELDEIRARLLAGATRET